jgi:hypothetical protein
MEDSLDEVMEFLQSVKSLEEYFGVDNLDDLERIVKGLEAQVRALTRHRDWFIERTGTKDIVQAKSRVDALMSMGKTTQSHSLTHKHDATDE